MDAPSNPPTVAPNPQGDLSQVANITNAPYIHIRVISFPTAANKKNALKQFPDKADHDTYEILWTAPKPKKPAAWLALFNTQAGSPIGDAEWAKRPWHYWGAALVKSSAGQGKHLIIWDCNAGTPSADARRKDVMVVNQVKLIEHAEKNGKINSVWYGGQKDESEQDSLSRTVSWIRSMALLGDLPFDEEADPRTAHCVRLTRR